MIGTSGKLMSLVSSVAGTLRYVYKKDTSAIWNLDYLNVQDIAMSAPYVFYAGINSTDSGNNRNINFNTPINAPYQRQMNDNAASNTSSKTVNLLSAPVAGNLLVAIGGWASVPGARVTPVGWTLGLTKTQGNTVIELYYKISDGTETGVTVASANSPSTSAYIAEYSGFAGVPVLDVTDSNGSAAATSVSTGAGVANTSTPAMSLVFMVGSGGLGNFSATLPTNSYQEDYGVTSGSAGTLRIAAKPLTITELQSTTLSWTTTRVGAVVLAVFKNGAAGAGNFLTFFNGF